ncbi:MAG: DUF885 family protein [Bacteroidota bacterium]
MKKSVMYCLLILTLFRGYGQSASEELNKIFKAIEKYESSDKAMQDLYQGKHPLIDFEVISVQYYKEREERTLSFISQLKEIDETKLDRQDQINKELMLFRLNDRVSEIKYEMYLIPMNAEGGFYNEMSFILKRLPFNSIEDYQLYLSWLPRYISYLGDYNKLLSDGMKEGIMAPKVIVNNTIQLLSSWNSKDPELSPYYAPFKYFPESISTTDQTELKSRAIEVLNESVIPYYTGLTDFFKNKYLSKAPEKPGVSFLPGGKEYYKDRIRFYTTFDISPDSVHNLGLDEVSRIRRQMDQILEELKFEGSFSEFLAFLRTDPQFYTQSPQELLNYAAWLSKRAEAGLPKLFKKLYTLPFTVEPVPDDIAPTYTAGRYVPGSWKQQRAGIYWVNTHFLESRPLYALPALTLHEAVPGHHLQGSLASELEDMPAFRNNYYISAFGEGWGLYSEYLGEEMGMYITPYDRFGRYTYEMWRACRLVVDTGIHSKGWSREQAIEYMQSNTALSLHEVNTEIDRYIGWPGQAVSYKMGEIKIKSLREYATKELGEKFNVRDFHYHVLKNGSVPLKILEEEIKDYVSELK